MSCCSRHSCKVICDSLPFPPLLCVLFYASASLLEASGTILEGFWCHIGFYLQAFRILVRGLHNCENASLPKRNAWPWGCWAPAASASRGASGHFVPSRHLVRSSLLEGLQQFADLVLVAKLVTLCFHHISANWHTNRCRYTKLDCFAVAL